MANRLGTLTVTTRTAVRHEGIVESIDDSGITINAREYGRQTKIDKFYPWSSVVAHSDEGEGFVVVMEDGPVAVYHGSVTKEANIVSVTTDSGRVISAGTRSDVTYQIIYDNDDNASTTIIGKDGRRQSARFDTKSNKSDGAAKPKKKAVAKPAAKPAKSGKSR